MGAARIANRFSNFFIALLMVAVAPLYEGTYSMVAMKEPSVLMPDGPSRGGLTPAGPLGYFGVAQVEVGDDLIIRIQTEEITHVRVIGDRTGAPDRCKAQGVGGELHVLDGSGTGGVVLERLHLVAATLGDHSYHHRGAEGLFSLPAHTPGYELLLFALSLGQDAGELGAGAGELATAPANKNVEAPRFGDPVVRRMDGALQDLL